MARKKARRRGFGYVRQLPSGRWQASYQGPDQTRHVAPTTYMAAVDAEAWLAAERKLLETPAWTSPADRVAAAKAADAAAVAAAEAERERRALTLRAYAEGEWLPVRKLAPLSRRDYEGLLKNHILPTLGGVPLSDLTRERVLAWFRALDGATPRARNKAWQLLHAIMATAALEHADLVPTNPVVATRDTRRPRRARVIEPLTLAELNTLADHMPPRLRVAVLVGCWGALRYGELSELRRRDVDIQTGRVRVQRAVIRIKGAYEVRKPKTDTGVRTLTLPKAIMPDLIDHMATFSEDGPDGLLFPAASGGHLHSTTFARAFAKAAAAAGRPDVTPHNLRHTGASLASVAGGTLVDVMRRLGHSTPSMALHYQHSLRDADERVARGLDVLAVAAAKPKPEPPEPEPEALDATGNVVPLKRRAS